MPIPNEITVEVFPNEVTAGFTVQETQLIVSASGPQGIPGPPGPAGGASFEHIQSSQSNTWLVTHNLGRYPDPTVFVDDDFVNPVLTDYAYNSINQMTFTFLEPHTGKVEL